MRRRPKQDIVHYTLWGILLQINAFWAKNAGATYQRAIQTCLGNQVERNAEAYIDDVVIKTKEPGSLIEDLEETFKNLKAWQWKLNPHKVCFWGPIRTTTRISSQQPSN